MNRLGSRIRNIVIGIRLFRSNQFFHSSSVNCDTFDIVMLSRLSSAQYTSQPHSAIAIKYKTYTAP